MLDAFGDDRHEAGHTVVEALLALTLLIVGVVAVANLFVVAGSANAAARHTTAAVAQASEVMERLKAIPFDRLRAGGSLDRDLPEPNRTEPTRITGDDHVLRAYNVVRTLPGIGEIRTRWRLTAIDPRTFHVEVVAESTAPLTRGRSRVRLASFRTCTVGAAPVGCP